MFFKHPVAYSKNEDGTYNVPRGEFLIYTAPVLKFAVAADPAKASTNGALVGVSFVQTREGAVKAYHRPEGDFLGISKKSEDPFQSGFVKLAHTRGTEITESLHTRDRIEEIKAAKLAEIKENK
ncbi:hypothetical protein ACFWAR_27915 [Streptomyces sp. NPDC059917]|uniref:hypothetical protein n=1 Tax=Streptomyces sp. NPDC059917 TaxID=3347002 RepID=UPI0036536731